MVRTDTVRDFVESLRENIVALRERQQELQLLVTAGEDKLGFDYETRVNYCIDLACRMCELAGYALYEASNLAPRATRRGAWHDHENADPTEDVVIREWHFDADGEMTEVQ